MKPDTLWSYLVSNKKWYKRFGRNGKKINRGWVEDTRLEAKAKNTKKNPRPRPRTAFPRTEPFEAKDRNARGQGQGHSRKYSPKKRRFSNFFSRDLQFIGAPRIFDRGKPKLQITWNDVIKIFPKRMFLRDKDIVGWKIWNRCCLFARNQDFAKGEGLS